MRLLSTLRLPLALSAAWFLLGTGCFTEPVDAGTGTGGTCEQGQPTCECLEGDCVSGYVCNDANRCIRENCNPGEEGCSCAAEGCLTGLECLGGICLDPGTTTVTTEITSITDTTTSSTVTDSTTTSPETDSATTNVTATVSTTEVPMTTTVGDSSSTTGMPESCEDMPACDDCFSCTETTECVDLESTCGTTPGCASVAECLQECSVEGLCFECCDGASAAAAEAALALNTCREDQCAGAKGCPIFPDPLCSQ